MSIHVRYSMYRLKSIRLAENGFFSVSKWREYRPRSSPLYDEHDWNFLPLSNCLLNTYTYTDISLNDTNAMENLFPLVKHTNIVDETFVKRESRYCAHLLYRMSKCKWASPILFWCSKLPFGQG